MMSDFYITHVMVACVKLCSPKIPTTLKECVYNDDYPLSLQMRAQQC